MKYFSAILFIFFIGCTIDNKYPNGGFDYPQRIADIDTNFYFYPLKDIEPQSYSFGDSYQYVMYREFDEPNLSIKPLPKKTLRLTYKDAFGDVVLIILTEGGLRIKKGNTNGLYDVDKSKLTEIEKYNLRILNKWYPIDTIGKLPTLKRFLDSMIKAFPQLLDKSYYKSIYEKQFVRTDKKFTYESSNIQLSEEQYNLITKQIDSSGFWTLPYLIKCDETIADGDEITVEANTKYKYQKVTVQICPNKTTKFIVTCQNIVHIARLDKEINLIWEEPTNSIR